jgi:hypothetical protein
MLGVEERPLELDQFPVSLLLLFREAMAESRLGHGFELTAHLDQVVRHFGQDVDGTGIVIGVRGLGQSGRSRGVESFLELPWGPYLSTTVSEPQLDQPFNLPDGEGPDLGEPVQTTQLVVLFRGQALRRSARLTGGRLVVGPRSQPGHVVNFRQLDGRAVGQWSFKNGALAEESEVKDPASPERCVGTAPK